MIPCLNSAVCTIFLLYCPFVNVLQREPKNQAQFHAHAILLNPRYTTMTKLVSLLLLSRPDQSVEDDVSTFSAGGPPLPLPPVQRRLGPGGGGTE